MVLEKLVTTQFSFRHSPFPSLVLCYVRIPYLQAVVRCVVPLCSYRVWTESRVLVSSLSVSGSVKYCMIMQGSESSAAFSDHCQRDFHGSREQVVSPAYGSQHVITPARSTCTQENDVCSVIVIPYFVDVRLGIFYCFR